MTSVTGQNLSEEEYRLWSAGHREAEALVHGRENKLQQSYAAMENRLELLGKPCTRKELGGGGEGGMLDWVLR